MIRLVTSESSVTETKTSDTPGDYAAMIITRFSDTMYGVLFTVPFLMGERLAEGSGATTVLSSGINVCTSGKHVFL